MSFSYTVQLRRSERAFSFVIRYDGVAAYQLLGN